MTSFSARQAREPVGTHVAVQVFAGPDKDHRALCGELILLISEAEDLYALLNKNDSGHDYTDYRNGRG